MRPVLSTDYQLVCSQIVLEAVRLTLLEGNPNPMLGRAYSSSVPWLPRSVEACISMAGPDDVPVPTPCLGLEAWRESEEVTSHGESVRSSSVSAIAIGFWSMRPWVSAVEGLVAAMSVVGPSLLRDWGPRGLLVELGDVSTSCSGLGCRAARLLTSRVEVYASERVCQLAGGCCAACCSSGSGHVAVIVYGG